jgi:hypothetical protein
MRKLQVDLDELMFAFDNASWEMSYYLDLETGQVVTIFDETRRELERIYLSSCGQRSWRGCRSLKT